MNIDSESNIRVATIAKVRENSTQEEDIIPEDAEE